MAKDPVCKMEVAPQSAVASTDYEGDTYYFCAEGCKEKFERNPGDFVPGKKESFFKRIFKVR